MVRPIELLDDAREPIRRLGARKGGGRWLVTWDQLDARGVLGLTWTAERLDRKVSPNRALWAEVASLCL